MIVPVCDPGARITSHGDAIRAALDSFLTGNRYILGPQVEAFEQQFADFLGAAHCVGVASGTDAITLALMALGVGPGDEVICPAMTAHGTAVGIIRAGAVPVFADVEKTTRCLDPRSVNDKLSPRTAAIVAVHLHGFPAPVEELKNLASHRGLCLIEDAAQAHGAVCGRRRVGTVGDAAAFSFYPTKNLGCLGDGGAVTTSDRIVAEKIRRLRVYGWDSQRVSVEKGFNSRLDEVQAAVLRVLLPGLDRDNQRRREAAARYTAALSSTPLGLPSFDPGAVFHQFAVLVDDRERFRDWLHAAGIGTDVHYPLGLHRMPAFPSADLPVTDFLAERLVSLPIQPEIAEPHMERILRCILDYSWN